MDWRRRQQTRAAVQLCIEEYLDKLRAQGSHLYILTIGYCDFDYMPISPTVRLTIAVVPGLTPFPNVSAFVPLSRGTPARQAHKDLTLLYPVEYEINHNVK